MDMPLISVIVPVYKTQKYLDRCLASITAQTYENLEILLVDDGSPDRSGAICDAWAEKDSRIRVLHQENRGSGAARNAALDAAKGELIGFVDSDDYIAPNFYAYLYDLMDSRTDITECGYLETREDHAEFDTQPRLAARFTPQEAMQAHIQDTAFRQLIWNKLYRREMLQNVRFPQEKTTIDDEYFTYQALGNARSLICSDKALYAYRQQEDSVMHRPYSLKRLNGIRAKQQRLRYIQKNMPELAEEAKRELLLSCLYGMQGTLEHLAGTEREEARAFLHSAVTELGAVSGEGISLKQKALIRFAESNLEGTAKLLNFLIRIHVLT